jgi:hypothetical protein
MAYFSDLYFEWIIDLSIQEASLEDANAEAKDRARRDYKRRRGRLHPASNWANGRQRSHGRCFAIFAGAGAAPPQALSAWDQAFLKAMYHSL